MTTTQRDRKEELLSVAKAKFGFVPNVLRQMSDSPAALDVYLSGQRALAHEGGRLDERERNLVQLAAARFYDCDYCTTAHCAIGRSQGVEGATLEAVASGQSVPDAEGGRYVEAAKLLLDKQGHLSGEDLARLKAEGIDREVLFEIVGGIAVKLVSTWVNHISNTEIDDQFR